MLQFLLAHLDSAISTVQTALYIDIVQPLMYRFGLMGYDEDTYDALYWLIVGVLEIGVMYAILRPLEALAPLEKWSDRRALRSDVIYTWIAKLGIVNIFFFLFLQGYFDQAQEWLRLKGVVNIDLDKLIPGVTTQPLCAFALYIIVLDFAGYWYHRWQHGIGVWWELHAVHHSQQQMSLWADDRNHILDDVIQACFFALIALAIGVPPAQYVVLVAVTNLAQSIQHVNARLHYGWLLERIVVSPAFHRRHHAIGYGHEGTKYGCNFGVLFPWWDMLFRSVSWNRDYEPTGIRDQLAAPHGIGRNYGMGFWAQQWYGLTRSGGRIVRMLRGQRAEGGHGSAGGTGGTPQSGAA